MGFDTVFLPVDTRFIQDKLLPYFVGKKELDDIFKKIPSLVKHRHRANDWGLRVLNAQPRPLQPPYDGWGPHVWRYFQTKRAQRKRHRKMLEVHEFNSDLHVWGRPFFIARNDVNEAVDQYLAARDIAEVDRLAAEMVENLVMPILDDPETLDRHVYPTDIRIIATITRDFRRCKKAIAGLSRGKGAVPGRFRGYNPQKFVEHRLPMITLRLSSLFTPGWIDSGRCWPTAMLKAAQIQSDIFETSSGLFEPIFENLPGLKQNLQATITGNYMVGGYVPPHRIAELEALLLDSQYKLKTAMSKGGWSGNSFDLVYRKLLEAVAYAKYKGFGFAEATDIYMPFAGMIN